MVRLGLIFGKSSLILNKCNLSLIQKLNTLQMVGFYLQTVIVNNTFIKLTQRML